MVANRKLRRSILLSYTFEAPVNRCGAALYTVKSR